MTTCDMRSNNGFGWVKSGDSWAKGYYFDPEGNFHEVEDLLDSSFGDVENVDDFASRLRLLNGCFAVIVRRGGQVFMATDRLASFPLFYTYGNGSLHISDDGWALGQKLGLFEADNLSVSEFLLSGWVVGDHTLLADVRQLQAGQYLYWDGESKEPAVGFYYKHLHGDYLELGTSEYYDELDSVYRHVFLRLIASVEGRTIVVPLSGGYDSRSIATMLKKLGYDKVICFTYGRPESFEVDIARKVAERLGYKWYFVNYVDRENWAKLKGATGYFQYASSGRTLPHVQDYIAVAELTAKSLVPRDAVFVAGHSGDSLGGSWAPHISDQQDSDLPLGMPMSDYVYATHFTLDNKGRAGHASDIKSHIARELDALSAQENGDLAAAGSLVEAFAITHRLARFEVNAVRVCEYFGHEWRVPLWDNELVEFWYRVPVAHRVGNDKLYDEYLMDRVFRDFGVGFRKKTRLMTTTLSAVRKSSLGKEMTGVVKHVYRVCTNKKNVDFDAFSKLYELCQHDLDGKVSNWPSPDNINSIFALWFLEVFLKDRLHTYNADRGRPGV
ncbi:MAG: asparagine synthase C-terminal domain-containing protein [Candidatus Cryosericum sp.]